jgi:PIN domain nuclease of toxin-antitoxin system
MRTISAAEFKSRCQMFLEGIAVRPITPEICALGAQFPDNYSHDPADRIIGGTARAEGLTLITHNENIRRRTLWTTVW